MFTIGKSYRVWSLKEGMGSREGEIIAAQGDMFMMMSEGIQITFHMATVACVELIDPDAEKARDKARHDARVAAWS